MEKIPSKLRSNLLKILLAGTLALPIISGAQNSFKPFVGVGYGPFRSGQSPTNGVYPSTNEIAADMPIVKNFVSQIRTYGTENNLFYIPRESNKVGVKCYSGAWIDNTEWDNAQLTDLAKIGNLNYSNTAGLVVGNEYLYRHQGDLAKLTNSINQVRNSVTNKTIKIGAAEQWHIWRDYPSLANSVDFMMVHIHPYWEQQNITNAANFVAEKFNFIKNLYPSKKIIIGETGWPSAGSANGEAIPSIANQERFVREFKAIAKAQNIDYMLFEFCDERWKGGAEGSVGGNWGLLDENRNLKSPIEKIIQDETVITPLSKTNLVLRSYDSGSYVLQKNSSLMNTNWIDVTNFTGAANTNFTIVPISLGNSPTMFYRVKFKYK